MPGPAGPVESADVNADGRRLPKEAHRVNEGVLLLIGRLLLVLVLLAIWQYADGRWVPDFALSSPIHVGAKLFADATSAKIWQDVGITSEELILGYILGAVLGIGLGVVFGLNRIARGIFEPVISAINGIPKVALAPLFLLWMGLGIASKVAIAAMLVSLLMFYNTLSGILVAPGALIDVLRVMGAGRATVIRKIMLPFLSTYIISGLKASMPLAVIGVVVGEFVGADMGVGYLIRNATDLFESAQLFAGIFILVLMTLIGTSLIQLLERRLLRWHH